jgi:hypothetical protein
MKAEKEKNVPKAEHYMKVTAIKMISETCPELFEASVLTPLVRSTAYGCP